MLWHGAYIGLDLSKSKTIDNLPVATGRFKLALIQKRIYDDACGDKSYIRTRRHLQMQLEITEIFFFSQRKYKISNISKGTKADCKQHTHFCNIVKEKL